MNCIFIAPLLCGQGSLKSIDSNLFGLGYGAPAELYMYLS